MVGIRSVGDDPGHIGQVAVYRPSRWRRNVYVGAAPMKIVLEEIGVRGDDVLRELRVVAHSPKIRLRPVWAIANVCDSIGGGPDVAEVICVILPGEASGRKQVH